MKKRRQKEESARRARELARERTRVPFRPQDQGKMERACGLAWGTAAQENEARRTPWASASACTQCGAGLHL